MLNPKYANTLIIGGFIIGASAFSIQGIAKIVLFLFGVISLGYGLKLRKKAKQK